jgi:hypothetical protein
VCFPVASRRPRYLSRVFVTPAAQFRVLQSDKFAVRLRVARNERVERGSCCDVTTFPDA